MSQSSISNLRILKNKKTKYLGFLRFYRHNETKNCKGSKQIGTPATSTWFAGRSLFSSVPNQPARSPELRVESFPKRMRTNTSKEKGSGCFAFEAPLFQNSITTCHNHLDIYWIIDWDCLTNCLSRNQPSLQILNKNTSIPSHQKKRFFESLVSDNGLIRYFGGLVTNKIPFAKLTNPRWTNLGSRFLPAPHLCPSCKLS